VTFQPKTHFHLFLRLADGQYLVSRFSNVQIAPLSNEIFPAVKLGDSNVVVCADDGSEIRFAITPKVSEKQAHLK